MSQQQQLRSGVRPHRPEGSPPQSYGPSPTPARQVQAAAANSRAVIQAQAPAVANADKHSAATKGTFETIFPEAGPTSFEPKVMVPFEHVRGRVPRRIEVERRRRHYEAQNVHELLTLAGLPLETVARRSRDSLPIEVHDDTLFESRNPQEWLAILNSAESKKSKFLPAQAIRTHNAGTGENHDDAATYTIEWCRVIDWSEKTNKMKIVWGSSSNSSSSSSNASSSSSSNKKIVNATSAATAAAGGGIIEGDEKKSNNNNKNKKKNEGGEQGEGDLTAEQQQKSDFHGEETEWIPRILVHLLADDPFAFVQRLLNAHRQRLEATSWIRFQLACDSMPTEGMQPIHGAVVDRVQHLGSGIPQLAPSIFPDVGVRCDKLIRELQLDWQRSHNRISLERKLAKRDDPAVAKLVLDSTDLSVDQIMEGPENSSSSATNASSSGSSRHVDPHTGLPAAAASQPHHQQQKQAAVDPDNAVELCSHFDFKNRFESFTFATYNTQPEVVRALGNVRKECMEILQGSLFDLPKSRQMSLANFTQMQENAIEAMASRLKNEWKDAICSHINAAFEEVGKGWLNVHEKDQSVYNFSKLRKFFVTVRYMMEDTLFDLVYQSLSDFTVFFEEVSNFTVNIQDMTHVKNAWPGSDTEDSIDKQPLFTVELVEGEDTHGVKHFEYSTTPEEFCRVIVGLFNQAIEATRNIPQVERFVMTQYFWKSDGEGPYLDTVKQLEERVCILRDRTLSATKDSLIPLTDYLSTYDELLDIIRLDQKLYIERFAAENHPMEEMREEIKKHLKAKKAVTNRIPYHSWIGNYIVDCHNFRFVMANKSQELAKLVMDLICKTAKSKCHHIRDEFNKINSTVQRKPINVEKLFETKNFILTLPEEVGNLTTKIEEMKLFYNLLEAFQYGLTDDDFRHKWEAIGWPRRLDSILDTVNKNLAVETENFHDIMIVEQEAFTKEVDNVKRAVGGFNKYTDATQAAEVAPQVKILLKQIKDCMEKARDFNAKQKLFGDPPTDYRSVMELDKEFKPYADLWSTAFLWQDSFKKWHTDPFDTLEPDEVQEVVEKSNKTMIQLAKLFRQDKAAMLRIVEEIKRQVDQFRPLVPLITNLRGPGMKDRHWEVLSEKLGEKIEVGETICMLEDVHPLLPNKDLIVSSCEVAAKEYQIEKSLKDMQYKWASKNFNIESYKQTKTYIMKDSNEVIELLDEHLNVTQQLQFSSFKAFFAEEIDEWEKKLMLISDILEKWLECQRAWRYLEPIFNSPDIAHELPKPSRMFEKVDKTWRKILGSANTNPNVITLCTTNIKILDQFSDCNKTLDTIQKELNDYLQSKRQEFPRFYFLSDEELLEILSQSKDPRNIDRHLRKLFESMKCMEWSPDEETFSTMLGFHSDEQEYVPFVEPLDPDNRNVEHWLKDLETRMKLAMHQQLRLAYRDYNNKEGRPAWLLRWPGQIVLAVGNIFWTMETEQALERDGSVNFYKEQLQHQLDQLITLVQSQLTAKERINMGSVITIEVHSKDTIDHMARDNVGQTTSFDWMKQLRFYFEEKDEMCHIRQVDAHFVYGGEYLGNTGRLVVTPLTDRIYLTLTGALSLCLGGAPAGPAGTGKTETTKDLAKALAKQCVVFNCQEGMTYHSMGKFFKGLAWSGAWACFDEFNRINVEVLSVVAQQVTDLQQACVTGQYKINFEGSDVVVDPTYAVFITMNPGYAGRTELPDNLKVLFRPVACMVPDYAMIGEIRLFSYGYKNARKLAQKMVATFRLSSEQLSTQGHYDFGMRAVNTVITAAGIQKRNNPQEDENILLLRALRDSNVPKFLAEDIMLFDGITSDLFPGIKLTETNYGCLVDVLKETCVDPDNNLQPVDAFVLKTLQLYDITILRHGLMQVGPSGSGKTMAMKSLQQAMTTVNFKQSKGLLTEFDPIKKVVTHICNPKAVTLDQLYGAYDKNTGEWSDGILCVLFRAAAYAEDGGKHWCIFDGPVDAVWIESMNTVLDENKKLCLVSGEIIQMSRDQTMMFEVEDLAEASPATVSRCGMIYMEPESCCPTSARLASWSKHIPKFWESVKSELLELSALYLDPLITFVRRNLKEFVSSIDNNLVHSYMKVISSFIAQFQPPPVPQGQVSLTPERLDIIDKCSKPLIFLSLIWSVGATCDAESREKFEAKMRELVGSNGDSDKLPESGSLYDYTFRFHPNPEEEVTPSWVLWTETIDRFKMDHKMPYSNIMVPTIDSIRQDFILTLLMSRGHNVAAVGPTGTGKSASMSNLIMERLPEKFQGLMFTFSSQTGANLVQNSLLGKLTKRRSHVFGAPQGKHFIALIDDTNLPQKEKYGAQPPIELLRQYLGHGGMYTYQHPIIFTKIIDVSLALAMGSTGGSRFGLTNRFMRFFNYVAFPELSDKSMGSIFKTILTQGFALSRFNEETRNVLEPIVEATLAVFKKCIQVFVPTPAHIHYSFNMRDVSKVFASIYESEPAGLTSVESLCRMWVHECSRVFSDRLINNDDRELFRNELSENIKTKLNFPGGYEELVPGAGSGKRYRLMFGDYCSADGRTYAEILDMNNVTTAMQKFLQSYNDEFPQAQMNLVMFLDCIEHVSRICRVLRMSNGHALLLGIGGSGRKCCTRLACFITDRIDVFSVEITKGFGSKEWKESIAKLLYECGMEEKKTCFLFSDTQIVKPEFLEDVASLLTSGDVDNVFDEKQMEKIMEKYRDVCLAEGLATTKVSQYSRFVREVRTNLHVVIAFSPIGEIFRSRMRTFPALIACTYIDWYNQWPPEALQSVSMVELAPSADLVGGKVAMQSVSQIFTEFHTLARETTERFFEETKRRTYVTPTSFLSLLETFTRLASDKKNFVHSQKQRLENGLTKLKETEVRVASLEEQLQAQQPVLRQTAVEIEEMMVKLNEDRAIAAEKEAVASEEERAAAGKADVCNRIKLKAADRLAQAEPALQEAIKVLRSLKLADISEMAKYQNPTSGVKRVVEAVTIMLSFGKCPTKYYEGAAGEKKKPNFYKFSKEYFSNPKGLLDTLAETYEKENMDSRLMDQINTYIEQTQNEPGDFEPKRMATVAAPCFGMVAWVNAMRTWFGVNEEVKPLRAELEEATKEFNIVMDALNVTRANLKAVRDKVAELERSYNEAIARQRALQAEVELTQAKLTRAARLIDGLGGEKQRWKELLADYIKQGGHIIGDSMLAAAFVAYCGPFTHPFRVEIFAAWTKLLDDYNIVHSEKCDIADTQGDPVQIQQWQIAGLPTDDLSTENALILFKSPKWPLLIDPQGQGNTWIRNMHKGKEHHMQIIKASETGYVKMIETCIRLGYPCLLENVGNSIDPMLEPILLKQTFNVGGIPHIRVGDSVIPYDHNFRLFMTTKLPNPTYTPEAVVTVALLNFFITPAGLEDQLLGKTVERERKDLEDKKQELTRGSAQMNAELKDLQDNILRALQETEGDILESEELIEMLEKSKVKSKEIKEALEVAAVTEKEIDEAREKYRPHAARGSLLFFCAASLSGVDPMYQFSLQWFITLFLSGITQAEPSEEVEVRIESLRNYFTYSFYSNVCRSLFEKHKLMFSMYLCLSIIGDDGKLDEDELRYLMAGPTHILKETKPNPATKWLTEPSWNEVQFISQTLPSFHGFDDHVIRHVAHYQDMFDSPVAHRFEMHEEWMSKHNNMTPLQRLTVTRVFRMDKVSEGVQDYVEKYIGEEYVVPPPINLADVYKDSDCTTPLIFIISPGSDPLGDLMKFAETMKMSKKLDRVSLGQGQGPRATELVRDGIERGTWVLLQNCHLAASFMPTLEQLVEAFNAETMKREFRLWLTSMPNPHFPVPVLQVGMKMTNEPPKGLRANMTRSYFGFKEDDLNHGKAVNFKKLVFAECFFHAVLQERRRFGSLGFNIAYEFNDSDRNVCMLQLRKFLDMYDSTPFEVLKFLTGQINYGGRVTDDWDRRCLMTMIRAFLESPVLETGYNFSPSGDYKTIDPGNKAYYLDHLGKWSINAKPEVFGLHDNADITCARNETKTLLETLLSLKAAGGGKPSASSPTSSPTTTKNKKEKEGEGEKKEGGADATAAAGGSGSGSAAAGGGGGVIKKDDLVAKTVKDIQEKMPKPFNVHAFKEKYPTRYEESMNTVLVQEAARYNSLLNKMIVNLRELGRALRGEVILSTELEDMSNKIYQNAVPAQFASYPSLKPLSSWVPDLVARCEFIQNWYEKGAPASFWMGGFYFPQAFLTASLQNYARKIQAAIDTISFGFEVLPEGEEVTTAPEKGAIVSGFFLEGARWDGRSNRNHLEESRPKELFTTLPAVRLDPIVERTVPKGVYKCPVYKTLTRAGTLSTTGHSTNFVMSIELPSGEQSDEHWIKRGVACIVSLDT